ncbi:MAG: hypothetical protein PHQ75_10050 [Thermoguttaceae bacterium]|nr:hypothetical protein [Thermoguttaceae bacterium]
MNINYTRRRFIGNLGMLGLVSFQLTPIDSLVPVAFSQEASIASSAGSPPVPAVANPGVWSFSLQPPVNIILTSDEQLVNLCKPDQEIDLSVSPKKRITTLRKICEETQKANGKTIAIFFDAFFRKYRPDQNNKPRQFRPDSQQYIEYLAGVSKFAASYGIGLELSLLTPLELGDSFKARTDQSGRWVQYREGYREKGTGRFCVSLWEQTRWKNNKGTIDVRQDSVRVFAFCEQRRLGTTNFHVVNENEIIELPGPFEITREQEGPAQQRRMTVMGSGNEGIGGEKLHNGFNAVMVVVSYQTPELDYFSPEARPFLEELVKKYHEAGINLNALYSDEVHIQQDSDYFGHHDNGEFTFRYLTKNMQKEFAQKFGRKYLDFEKYLVYFLFGQHDWQTTVTAKLDAQHIFSPDRLGVQKANLLRRRYYDLLHDQVVRLFSGAKRYAESLYGKKLLARNHSTWAQSPTIDYWTNRNNAFKYEYTPDFVWSNTVQQAAAACDDSFRWNDFLTGGGNDYAEGGWADRDYYGQAMASSTGSLNDWPNAYVAAWGQPLDSRIRYSEIRAVYGNATKGPMKAIEEAQHRCIEVLMLYPISLVACTERFGSWMVLYGYANYITAERLLMYGKVNDDGTVTVRGRTYSTICALYEPLPPVGLLPFLENFAAKGGKIVWSGPPAQLDGEGNDVLNRWCSLFGIEKLNDGLDGVSAPGRKIDFYGTLKGVPSQDILTDFPIDRIYPAEISKTAKVKPKVIALCGDNIVGLRNKNLLWLGFRPRDDQAASLGYETRTWYEVLFRMNAYPSTKNWGRDNDNPVCVSRTTRYLATAFPNGTIALTVHYSRHVETWANDISRNAESDKKLLERNPIPSTEIRLEKFKIAGHEIGYAGSRMVAWRLDKDNRLIAFYGKRTKSIEIDGKVFVFCDEPLIEIAWAPVAKERRVPRGAVLEIWTSNQAHVHIPLYDPGWKKVRVFERTDEGICTQELKNSISDGCLEFCSLKKYTGYFVTLE